MNVCGASNTNTSQFPYAYFYNPTSLDLSRRTCVKVCPSYINNSLTNIDCYSTGNNQNKCTFDVIVYQNGSFNTTPNTNHN